MVVSEERFELPTFRPQNGRTTRLCYSENLAPGVGIEPTMSFDDRLTAGCITSLLTQD